MLIKEFMMKPQIVLENRLCMQNIVKYILIWTRSISQAQR